MLWVRPELEQPCSARRRLEQQREQRAVCQSQQQQHAVERQQQYWVPVCEGDSERGGHSVLTLSSGRSARVHGLPQCPERKPTGRSLFPAERGTKTGKEQGLVARAEGAGNAPVPDSAHPGGMNDNSPTFQRWVRELRRVPSPEGTAEPLRGLSAVPPGHELFLVLLSHRLT